MKKFLFLFLFLTACANNSVHTRIQKSTIDTFSASSDDYVWHNYFLAGVFQEKGVDAERVCRNRGGVAAILTEQRWFQSLIQFATLGIYSPRITYIYCMQGVSENNVLDSVKPNEKPSVLNRERSKLS